MTINIDRHRPPDYAATVRMGLITTKKAAELLGITAVRVRQLIASGQLQSQKAGRDHLLEESEVFSFDREARRPRGRPPKGNGKKTLRVR